jgi:hypothetical protein
LIQNTINMEAVLEKPRQKPSQKIPSNLIYEVMDGSPIYYKGYKDVLKGEKTVEDIMPSSFIQVLIVAAIVRFLNAKLAKRFIVGSNESGLHLSKSINFANDIQVIEKSKIKDFYSNKFLDIAPKIVFEIDTQADTSKFESPDEYFYGKTQKMLDFGVEKVIWVMTITRKILIAENHKPWLIVDWDAEIEVMDEIKFVLNDLLKEEASY